MPAKVEPAERVLFLTRQLRALGREVMSAVEGSSDSKDWVRQVMDVFGAFNT